VVRKNLRPSGGARDDTVFVVKSVEHRARDDRHFPVEPVTASLQSLEDAMLLRNSRTQGRVRSAPVVVGHPRPQSSLQMPFAQRNNPIETLSPQSPD
jgi:hypothetical protein